MGSCESIKLNTFIDLVTKVSYIFIQPCIRIHKISRPAGSPTDFNETPYKHRNLKQQTAMHYMEQSFSNNALCYHQACHNLVSDGECLKGSDNTQKI